jgi:hypothetical protein
MVKIIVLENRPYVISGAKTERFEGLNRLLSGIPISHETIDGSTMANYLAERLSIGFSNAGFEASIVTVPKGSSSKRIPNEKERSPAGLNFVVDMRDWRYDMGGFRPSFKYDISVAVYAPGDSLLANEDFGGTELMPTGGFEPYTVRYAEVYQDVFDRVFASQAIAEALKGHWSPSKKAGDPAEERIRRLQEMVKEGLISPADLDRERQRILKEI